MPRKKKSIEENREQVSVDSVVTGTGQKRKAVRVYPDELCPEWGNLPKQQQTMLVVAAARLGTRQILQSPELRCALGIEKPENVAFPGGLVNEGNDEEPGTDFVLDLGG